MNNQRRKFSADFKSKVALEALKEQKTIAQLAEQYELHPTQITEWKKQAQERMAGLKALPIKLSAHDRQVGCLQIGWRAWIICRY